MKRKILIFIATAFVTIGMMGVANAALTVIGTADYDIDGDGNADIFGIKLIYDDDSPFGPITWLDYSNGTDTWTNQVAWAANIGSFLSNITINPIFDASAIDWSTGWRLPLTVDGPYVEGYEGDPDGDGLYSYTAEWNLANSEMGHLYFIDLGNKGGRNPDGTWNSTPPPPDYFLEHTGDFINLLSNAWYWSGTLHAAQPNYAWLFCFNGGIQRKKYYVNLRNGIAVRPGLVVAAADADGDGYLSGEDCDDADSSVYPGAQELCDGADNDCDGVVPENEFDDDGDGYSECAGDCDDSNFEIHPNAYELPGDTVDDNCDGSLGECDPNNNWNNHGQYVRCVAHETDELIDMGVLTEEEGDLLISTAAQSDVGKK